MNPLTLATSITPDTSGEFTAVVVISGIGIVFLILVVLIVVFRLFGSIVSKSTQNKKKTDKTETAVEKKAPIAQPSKPKSPEVQNGVNSEVVAAISAAVYAVEGENAVVTSVSKAPRSRKASPIAVRNPWGQAAVTQNTRPF